MPTYEYACTSCGEHVEVVQSFKDHPLTECPLCQGTLKKVFAPIGVVFKGSGFYKTDSRSASSRPGSSGSGSSATSDGGSATSTSDGGKSSASSDGGKSSASSDGGKSSTTSDGASSSGSSSAGGNAAAAS
jgi:putative FmdB family regulatory protein